MKLHRIVGSRAHRSVAVVSSIAAVAGGILWGAPMASAVASPCTDGSTPTVLSTVTCSTAGSYTLTVPAGTTSVDVDVVGAGGGAGYPVTRYVGGDAGEVSGVLSLPAGTAYLFVLVGAGGQGGTNSVSFGGGGSAIFALDSAHALLAKTVIAGGGGGASYNVRGGDAGSAGPTSDVSLASGGSPGVGAVGGAGGAGTTQNGTAGGSDVAGTLTVATGGIGALQSPGNPNGARGGGGGGGYGGGGGGGSGGFILDTTQAGGGGGSSLASSYVATASVGVKSGTGGSTFTATTSSPGSAGSVVMTFNGAAVPGAPTGVTATPGNGQASVAFTAPASDNGSPITSYTVTSAPGGLTATCPGSPCVVTGLTNGTSYTFTVHATNANGDSPESAASAAVTPAIAPSVPTAVVASAGAGQASVSFSAPASNGGSAITSYTVTSAPGSVTASCPGSPCVITGLTNGTAYTFTVHATNAIGNSPESAASSAVTPESVPGAPTAVSATPGDGQVSVSFTAPLDTGGSAITSYTVTSSPAGLTATCPGRPCVITGLTNGTAYTFTVHATNATGDSAESTATAAVTPASLPGAPSGVVATAGDAQASVTFTAPVADGGSAITSYTVTSSPGGVTAICPGSPCVITGLANGTAYTFTVHATNAIGDSPESLASSPVQPAGAPDAPTGVAVTPGDEQVSISFPVPGNGGSAITAYQVSTDGGLTWTTLTATTTGATVTGTVTGLTNGTTYQVRVRAVNANGPGTPSSVTPVTPATVPDAPTGVAATRGNGSASISFAAPASGGSAITSYTVTSAPGGITATCPGTPCVVSGLVNGTAYTFTVHATNSVGDSPESVATASVTPATVPSTPSAVSVTPGNGQVAVSFTAPTSTGGSAITGYEYSTDNGATWHLVTTTGTAPVTATIPGLVNGTTYPVQVRAVNSAGASIPSAAVPVTPATTPGPPTGAVATGGAGQASVSFTAPASTGGAAVTSYTITSAPGGLTATCPGSPCVIAGLTNGTSYTFTVHATNSVGDSSESAATTPVTPVSAPAAPSAPTGTATGSAITLSFGVPDAQGSPITGYEYSLDNGATWITLTATTAGATVTGAISGLTPGTQYAITVRAVNAIGNGTASEALTISTLPAAVPTPTVTPGIASATVSWTASTTSSVTGYTVYANPGPATCTTASISATSCVIGATSGADYTYTVIAHAPGADSEASPVSPVVTADPPEVPADAPTGAPTTLTTTEGTLSTVIASQSITLVGTGYLPYSSVTLILYSTPIVLGTTVTNAVGNFSATVTLPATLAAGSHNIVASGVDATGAPYLTRMAVTVAAADIVVPGTGTVAGNDLASTGAPITEFAISAVLCVVAGGALLISTRRRRHYAPSGR